jgi:hypothetical protein
MIPILPLIILAWIGKFICRIVTGSGKPKQSKHQGAQLAFYLLVLLPLSTLVIGTTLLSFLYCGIVYGIFPLIGLA